MGSKYFSIVLPTLLVFEASSAYAYRYTFIYRTPDQLKINVEAESRDEGYHKAAKLCFNILTGGHYPGEEAGLAIIDTCANPINYNK